MARKLGNRTAAGHTAPERVRWTVDLLDVRPADHILEIGCGPGHAAGLICERLTRGTLTAIDRSPVAVARTRERNRGCIAAGHVCVEQSSLASADLGRRFKKVFAINVNAFWTTPGPSLLALGRLLHPKGTAWLVYEPPTQKRLSEFREWLPTWLEEHRFRVADVKADQFAKGYGLAVIGRPVR